jgi:hypothetical protein
MGVLPFKHFHAGAVALALAMHGSGCSQQATRAAISEARHVGPSALNRWMCLQRWCLAAAKGRLFELLASISLPATNRQIAARVAFALRAHGGLIPQETAEVAIWRGAMTA